MNKLWIDWVLCIVVGVIPGVLLFYDWKIAIISLIIPVVFHIWRWKNWNKIFAILGSADGGISE